MNRMEVQSSNLRSVGYDEKRQILEIEFSNSNIYEYTRVSKDIYVALMQAKKKGAYFSKYIQDNRLYGCTKTYPILKWVRS